MEIVIEYRIIICWIFVSGKSIKPVMDEGNKKGLSSIRTGSFKSTMSGRSTPRNSPSFRRAYSSRTPRKEARISGGVQWFRSNRLVYWLLLITLWAYLGFYVQSRWAHGDDNEFSGFGGMKPRNEISNPKQVRRRDLLANSTFPAVSNSTDKNQISGSGRIDVILAAKDNEVLPKKTVSARKKSKRVRGKGRIKQKTKEDVEINDAKEPEQDCLTKNTTYGLFVGPFGSIEDRILEWSPEKRSGTCDRKSDFARLVWSRRLVLIFHELSMTGAPISMMELATELLSCGATVSAVVLSRKGGLMTELARRRIKVVEDRAELSFKTAMKADLIIAGSAVCASWIDQYIERFPAGGSQIAWWIMENRREYFDRAKVVMDRVKMLFFLSELQTKQWLTWCQEDNIKLRSQPALVPLSVNDELAFVAGIKCSLNTESATPEKMIEKRHLVREEVRKEMGLTDKDMLVISLSSINPGKGQLMLLESASLLIKQEFLGTDPKIINLSDIGQDHSNFAVRHHLRGLLRKSKRAEKASTDLRLPSLLNSTNETQAVSTDSNNTRSMLYGSQASLEQDLKVLIGSVGSKSNKVPYIQGIKKFLSEHPNISKSVLWTPATTRVASVYSAADAYVINSQGLGETFGRVTIEAMAFGLPVLGTEAGGTIEIVEHNVTGLLHPLGRPGASVLAENLRFLLRNPVERQRMGIQGRRKVEKMYLKKHMYKRLVDVLVKCMRGK